MEESYASAPRVMVRSHVCNEYIIRLARDITDPDDFAEEFMTLASATENDVVIINVVTSGGALVTCDMLCDAIRECEARTIARIGIECASAGSAVALSCDEWQLTPSSTMMIHELQYQPPGGSTSSVKKVTEYTERLNESFVRRTYQGFLTEEEIEQVLDGKELYFYYEDLMERLPVYAQRREERYQAELEEQEEA